MIKTLLSWLGVRHDNLIDAQKAILAAGQMIAAQQETIEGQRVVIDLLKSANKILIEEQSVKAPEND